MSEKEKEAVATINKIVDREHKKRILLTIFVFIVLLLSLANTIYLTEKISKLQKLPGISSRATQAQVNLCIDVPPPEMSPIGNLTLRIGTPVNFKVNATSSSGRTVYFYDNTTLFNIGLLDGWINFTPTISQTGLYLVRIWVTHNLCGVNISETIYIQVGYNHPPVWSNLTPAWQNITEDKLFTLNLSQYVTDEDNDPINFTSNNSILEFPAFNLTVAGLLNFTPNDTDVGVHIVRINASDLINSTPEVFILNVTNVNEQPYLSPFPSEFYLCENVPFYFDINASDEDLNIPNSQEELFFYDNLPDPSDGGMFNINEQTGEIIFTPEQEYSELPNPVIIYVSDGEMIDLNLTDFFIVPVNDAPEMENISARTVWVNETINFTINVNDEEDGGNFNGDLNFSDDTNLFNISSSNGSISYIGNISDLGTYNISICVTDKGIPVPVNASLCGNDYLPKTICKNLSFTVTDENRPPNITDYYPRSLVLEIQETRSLYFNISKYDPDGTIPTTYWLVNGQPVSVGVDEYTFTTTYGYAGFYVIKAEITDGLLNDSVEWNVTVRIKPQGGGGGGGGATCTEKWTCSEWFDCATLDEAFFNVSKESFISWRKIWTDSCKIAGLPSDICGIQVRYCKDTANCSSLNNKPKDYMACVLQPPASCFDGVRNCHGRSCELLIDCGGPCKPCPGEARLEYPKGLAICGDNKCSIKEIFTCFDDCYLFWLLCLIAVITILLILYLVRKKKKEFEATKQEAEQQERMDKIKEIMQEIKEKVKAKNKKQASYLIKETITQIEKIKDTNERIKLKNNLFRLENELRKYKIAYKKQNKK